MAGRGKKLYSNTTHYIDVPPPTFKTGGTYNNKKKGAKVNPYESWQPYEDEFPIKPFDRYSCCVKKFRDFIAFRWTLRWPLQKRLMKGFTAGEVLLIFPLVAFYIAVGIFFFIDKTIFGTGYLTGFPFFIVFAAVGHNSLFQFLAGIPFERCITYHRYAAYIGTALGILHGAIYELEVFGKNQDDLGFVVEDEDFSRLSGWLLQGAVFALIITSVWAIRRNHFDIFYRFHIILILILFVFACMHAAVFGIAGGILWMMDIGYRLFSACVYNETKATFTVLPAEVIKVSFNRRDFKYKSGQYLFICVPGLSPVQWHPFSISSSPRDETVSIHIRVLGDWTKALYKMVSKSRQKSMDLNVLIEGPYGGVTVNIDDNTYQHILMISGGIGVTPMHSITNSLREQYARGRPLKKVHNLWTVRDRYMIDSIYTDKDEVRGQLLSMNKLPLSFQPDILRFDGIAELDDSKEPVFKTELYLTNLKRGEAEYIMANIDPKMQPWLRKKRPNLKETFKKMRAIAAESGATDFYNKTHVRVAVLVCGPAKLVEIIEELAASSSDENVTFDFHKETFEF